MTRIVNFVSINGIDVTSYVLNWTTTDTFGNEIPDLDLNIVRTVTAVITPENGQEVIVKRGPTTGQEYNVFKGYIDTINKDVPVFNIKAKGKLIQLVQKSVNTSYDKDIDVEAGVGSAIINDLITSYGGLSTNSGATVVSTGGAILIQKFVCKKTDIFERIRTLLDIYDYQIFYNLDDDFVYVQPIGYTTNANALTVGSNVSTVPKWEFDNTQLVNQIRIEGAEQLVETTESGRINVTSGYTTTGITLLQQPFSVKLYMDAANPPTTLRLGGVESSTTSFFYSVDEINKKILPKSGTTFTANDYAEIRYSYPQPVPILRKRQTSIDAYGLSSTTKHFSDIKTVDDAITRGDIYLNTFSEPFVRVTLNVPSISNNYKVGQNVSIVDNYSNENRTLVINKITKSYPHRFDILQCGDKEYALAEYNRMTMDRIKRLEEELNKNDDILIQIIDFTRSNKLGRRYSKLQKETITSLGFILGHPNPIYSDLGTAKLGTAFGSTTTQKIIQGNMIYEEYVYDTTFHDSVNSTATFNTTTKEITFTDGQIWYSSAIDVGTTLTQIKVDLGTVTGTIAIAISSDNKVTWQSVTEGVLTTVTSSDGLGTYIKLTSTGVSTVARTVNSLGQITEPNVKVTMIE